MMFHVDVISQPTSIVGLVRRPAWAEQDPLLAEYYDCEWGVPVRDERGVFEGLTLEAFQSGLSWLTVLRKREALRAAFAGFDVDRVACFGDVDQARLLGDTSIIRNRRKVFATIKNAQAAVALRENGTDLASLIWSYMPERTPTPASDHEVPHSSPESVALACELKRRGFSCVGPVSVYALMAAIGVVDIHLVTSHRRGCSGLWGADGERATPGHS